MVLMSYVLSIVWQCLSVISFFLPVAVFFRAGKIIGESQKESVNIRPAQKKGYKKGYIENFDA